MKKVGITLMKNSYTPEAYAYQTYLEKKGYSVQLDFLLDPDNDINIHFMGFMPFWKKNKGRAIEIHDYQSLSTPPRAEIKNKLKRILNSKPSGRIFLNNTVRKGMGFNDSVPYIERDMGVDDIFFQERDSSCEYDVVYAGSISGRKGLVEVLLDLSKKYKVVIAGSIPDECKDAFKKNNITMLGKVNRDELAAIYRTTKYGLNYTPDAYPFNIQTSTKTLEYLAAGLHVISNKYQWSDNFFKEVNYKPIWLTGDIDKQIETIGDSIVPDMQEFSWHGILEKSNFEPFLRSFL